MTGSRAGRTLDRTQVVYPSTAEFATGAARALGGALLFSLPMLMTMELWWLGFYMDPFRLALMFGLLLPLLVRLSRYGGIRRTASLLDDLADALVVIALSFATTAFLLWLFGVIGAGMPAREVLGKIAVQTIPASIGAMLARNQLGSKSAGEQEKAEESYWGELFLMVVGALFLSLNLSPTEEIVLLAYKIGFWREVALAVLSMAAMHAFVYNIGLRGSHSPRPGETFLSLLVRFTLAGYALVLVVSLYVLWSFGRTDGTAWNEILSAAVVLSFPGALGAAAARLIL